MNQFKIVLNGREWRVGEAGLPLPRWLSKYYRVHEKQNGITASVECANFKIEIYADFFTEDHEEPGNQVLI